jgi:hypothetical protein
MALAETWLDDVRNALQTLGGEAHLLDIYDTVSHARQQRGAHFKNCAPSVLSQLRENSQRKGRNIFERVGPAMLRRWRLKGL